MGVDWSSKLFFICCQYLAHFNDLAGLSFLEERFQKLRFFLKTHVAAIGFIMIANYGI